MVRSVRTAIVSFAVLMLFVAPARSDTWSGLATHDTWIDSSSTEYCGDVLMFIGDGPPAGIGFTRFGFIRGTLSPDAVITDAWIELNVHNVFTEPNITLYRIFDPGWSWANCPTGDNPANWPQWDVTPLDANGDLDPGIETWNVMAWAERVHNGSWPNHGFAFLSTAGGEGSIEAWTLESGLAPRLVVEYDLPSSGPNLSVTPSSPFEPEGPSEGPFVPPSEMYTLTNVGDAPLEWLAEADRSWIQLSDPTAGTLAVQRKVCSSDEGAWIDNSCQEQ